MPTEQSSPGPYPTHVLSAHLRPGAEALRDAPRHAVHIDRRQATAAAKYPDPPPNWHASVPIDDYPATGGLDEWTRPDGREDRALDAAIEQREQAERENARAIPDVYDVADAVLAPFVEKQTTIPRRLQAVIGDALTARGVKPTRANRLAEAARMLAQDRAASDPEMSLALLMRAALMFKPEGGWRPERVRTPSDGFGSVRALLSTAFSELSIGIGNLSLEIAQNRARTHSLPGEVFISASHCGTARAKNAAAIERTCDAQRLIAKAGVHPADVRILFEKLVLDRFKNSDAAEERRALTIAVRARHARLHGVALPVRPAPWGRHPDGRLKVAPPKTPPSEQEAADLADAAWFLAAGLALHGTPPAAETDAAEPSQATIERHVRRQDAVLLAALDEAEQALRRAIGQERRAPKSRRRVQNQIYGSKDA